MQCGRASQYRDLGYDVRTRRMLSLFRVVSEGDFMRRVIIWCLVFGGLACSGGEETGSAYTDEEVAWLRVGGAPESRAEAEECDDYRDPGVSYDSDGDGEVDDPSFQQVNCTSDAECVEGRNGRCESDPSGTELFCSYDECLVDEDCTAGSVCVCGGDQGRNDCVPSTCTVDDDCERGSRCVQDNFDCHTGGFHCMSPDADCIRDDDCPDEEGAEAGGRGDCSYNTGEGLWECAFNECE